MAKANEQLASALEHAGYLGDLGPDERAELRSSIVDEGYGGAINHPTRVAFADIEELAEGGVGEWVEREIKPLLSAHHIDTPSVEDHFPENPDDGYSVTVLGKEYTIWQQDGADSQMLATVAAFAIVNDVLAGAGTSNKLFFVDNGGGNDGQAWLLTPAQAQAIRDFGGVDRRYWPFIPTTDPPLYGQYR